MVCKCCCLAQGNYSLAALCFHFLLRTRTQLDTNINTSISPYHSQEDKVILKGISQLSSPSHNRDEKNEFTKGKCLGNPPRAILWRAVISQEPWTHRMRHFCWKASSQAAETQLSPPCCFISYIQSKGICVHSAGCLWLWWVQTFQQSPHHHICQLLPPCRRHN